MATSQMRTLDIQEDNGDYFIVASDKEGREYTLDKVLTAEQAAKTYVAISLAEYKIDAGHWNMRIPYGTDAWLNDGMEERQIEDEKMGLG